MPIQFLIWQLLRITNMCRLANGSYPIYFYCMSIEMLQSEVRALTTEQRRKLMAFIVAIEDQNRPGYAEELARKIDDKTPGHWLTDEQCESELGLDSK
ncbi:MAG TPA: hypothetical protein VMF08_06800 [Candidatus Sulfotelmatobacter sp.]|nr:hypothetical protein [Candidatus Sulfotelmatobacter sp.]